MRLVLIDDDGDILTNASIVISDAQGNEFKYKEVDSALAKAIQSDLSTPSSHDGTRKNIELQSKFRVAVSFLGISGLIHSLKQLKQRSEQHVALDTARSSELIDSLAQAMSSLETACGIIKDCSSQAVEELDQISSAIQDSSSEISKRVQENLASDAVAIAPPFMQTKNNNQQHEIRQPDRFELTFIRQRFQETWLETASRIFSDDGFHSFEELFFSNQELAEAVASELWSLHEKITLAWKDKYSNVIVTDGMSGHSEVATAGSTERNGVWSEFSNAIASEAKSHSLGTQQHHLAERAPQQIDSEPGQRQYPPGFENQAILRTRLELQQAAELQGQDASGTLPPTYGHAADPSWYWGHQAFQSLDSSFHAHGQVQASQPPTQWYLSPAYQPEVLRPPPGLGPPSLANTKLVAATPWNPASALLTSDVIGAKTTNPGFSALARPFRPATISVESIRTGGKPTVTANARESNKELSAPKEQTDSVSSMASLDVEFQSAGTSSEVANAKQVEPSDSSERRVSPTSGVSKSESPAHMTWAQTVSSAANDHDWTVSKESGKERIESTKPAQHCPVTGQRLGRWCTIKGLRRNTTLSDVTEPIDVGPIAAVEISASTSDGSCSAAVLFLWEQSARTFVKDAAHEPYGANVNIELGQWYEGRHDLTGMVRLVGLNSSDPERMVKSRRIILSGPALFLTNKKIKKLVSKVAALPLSAIESTSVFSGGCAGIVFANVWSAGRVQQIVTDATAGEFAAARATYAKDKGERIEKKEA